MKGIVWQNVRMFLWMTLLTGVFYPLLVTLIAQVGMKEKAEGELITLHGKTVGAMAIAQKFEKEIYFWPRPSAIDYNPLPSGGSNLGPISLGLKKAVQERKERLLKAYGMDEKGEIPPEFLFASGSGLDPHITIPAAYFQIARIAKARGIEEKAVRGLVDEMHIKPRFAPRAKGYVNVLALNLLLDKRLSGE